MKEKWGVNKKNLGEWSKKSWVKSKKYQMIHAKRRSWHPKTVKLKTFCPNLTFKNRYTTSKNGSIGRLFVAPPLSEIGKKIGKMSKYTPHFQSTFGTADCDNSRHWQGYTVQVFDNEGRFIKCFGKEGPQEGSYVNLELLFLHPL